MRKVATLMFVWALVDSCSITITVDSSIGVDCASELSLVANQSVCRDLESVLQRVASQATIIQHEECIQVNIMPGNYTITSALRIRTNLVLSSISCCSDIRVTFQALFVNQSSEPFYVLGFSGVDFVVLNGIDFMMSPGIIGFENVSNVTITSCSFSYFTQGAVDIFNCAYPRVENCNFMHNGPTNITKSQIYLGNSGGLSIGFNYESQIQFNPYVHLLNSTFINNSVDAVNTEIDELVIRKRIFIGRGGGASIIFKAVNAISIVIEWCYFRDNFALGYGGGLYIVPDGHTNHTVVVNNTKFINNNSQRGGGLHVGFIDPGALNRVISALVYNAEFIGNNALYGGGLDFAQSNFIQIAGEVGNHGLVENCTFKTNHATNFGAAVAITTLNLFNTRERVTAFDIINCIFTSNTASNKAGVVAVSYFALHLQGENLFINNSGSVMTVVGAVVYIIDGSNVQVINNSNANDGSAFNLESLGQMVMSSNVLVIFEGNVGRFGAAISKESLRYLPESFDNEIFNPLCFIRHIDPSKPPNTWKNENISITFENNTAAVGAAIYSDNIALCSWIQFQEPFFNKTEFFRSSAMKYKNNRNKGHSPDDYDTRWDIQSPVLELTIHNPSISAYPGQTFLLSLIANDEFGNPTISVIRLLDSDYLKDEDENGQVSITFSKTAALIDQNVSMATFLTSFYTNVNKHSLNTIDAIAIFTSYKYTTTFNMSALDCPSGTVLESIGRCLCNYNNTYINDCRGSNILFVSGFWASESNEPGTYGDHVTVYPCPIGYCQCVINDGICESSTDFKKNDNQCSCLRSGVLCGNCDANMGVSALLNKCVTCSETNGLLIATLVIIDAFVYIFLILVPFAFPSWLYSCLFYIQLLPILTEHFPVTFATIHPYLYYVSSGLSFYFVYDFCLYPNMSPLVSYFIRYLPLFTAIIVCPIILAIRWQWFKHSHHSQWHGLWWILLLMYTHTVHTSMSILNCPRLPNENKEFSNVWYINGNMKCFSGWHTPLAVLAILVLFTCLAAIPVIIFVVMSNSKNWKFPIIMQHCIRNIAPVLMEGIRDEVRWFGSVELLRRVLTLLFIVAVPWDEYSSIFLIIIILFLYGYVQPYKSMISNVLEIVLAIDVLIMLALKNSNQIPAAILSQQPNDTVSAINNCTDINNVTGISPLVAALTPFYYIPMCVTLVGGAMWMCRKLHSCFQKDGYMKSSKLGHLFSRNLPHSVSEIEISLQNIAEADHSTTSLTTFYLHTT